MSSSRTYSRKLLEQRTLLKQLVVTDFKLRYQGSILGYLWSLLKPLMMFGILYVIFTYVIPVGKGVPHFPAYLLLGIVVWTFFVEATTMGMGSVIGRGDLIRKVKITKVSIVFAAVLSASVNFALNGLIVIVFMIFSGAEVQWELFILVPFLIIEVVLLTLGLALILSALYVKYRDMAPIWEIVLQAMFYATAIIFPFTLANDASHRLAQFLALNPLLQIIQDMREILITPVTLNSHEVLPTLFSFAWPLAMIVILLCVGWLYFSKNAAKFAEEL